MFLKYGSRAALEEARKRRLEDRPYLFLLSVSIALTREDSVRSKYTALNVYFKRRNISGEIRRPQLLWVVSLVTWHIKTSKPTSTGLGETRIFELISDIETAQLLIVFSDNYVEMLLFNDQGSQFIEYF